MTIKVSDLGQMAFFDNITFIIMVANLNQISRIFCLHGLNYSSHSLFARFATVPFQFCAFILWYSFILLLLSFSFSVIGLSIQTLLFPTVIDYFGLLRTLYFTKILDA